MKKTFWMFIVLFFTTSIVHAQSEKRLKEFNLSKSSVAISGYDPVAYFTEKKAVKGNQIFISVYEGVAYHFSSQKNLDLFRIKPASYEPQYGGWCAYAMGVKAEKVEVDPETFKISDGKLYLFYNKYFTNTLKGWNKDETNLTAKANASWHRHFFNN